MTAKETTAPVEELRRLLNTNWFEGTRVRLVFSGIGKPRRKRRDDHRTPSISPRISSSTGTSRSTTLSMSSAVGGTQPSFRLALLTKSWICLRSASASVKVTPPFSAEFYHIWRTGATRTILHLHRIRVSGKE